MHPGYWSYTQRPVLCMPFRVFVTNRQADPALTYHITVNKSHSGSGSNTKTKLTSIIILGLMVPVERSTLPFG